MSAEAIEDPIEFFASLGNLHDVRVNSLTLDIDEQILYLVVDDLYWNFEGSPEYPGERPCALVFLGVTAVGLDVDIDEGLRISDLRVIENTTSAKPFRLEVDLNIGGVSMAGKSIVASFASVEIEDVED